MGEVMRFDALLASTPVCSRHLHHAGRRGSYSLTIPSAGGPNFAWLAFSFPAEVMSEACGRNEASSRSAYRLDAATQKPSSAGSAAGRTCRT